MEYGASLTYEDQIIDMEDPNFLVPKAAGGNHRSTTPLSQESTDSCHNNEAFEKGKIYLRQRHLYFSQIGIPIGNLEEFSNHLLLTTRIFLNLS